MARPKIAIHLPLLRRLYVDQGLSARKLAIRFRCSAQTVMNRCIEIGLPLHAVGRARWRYQKHKFTGNDADRAYLLGFAIGDLSVHRFSEHGDTIVARCHTTQWDQVDVMRKCFAPFGHVTISQSNHGYHVSAYLDALSFDFLTHHHVVPAWVRSNAQWAFMAGYSDAEGNFIINQGRARMKIDAYDHHVLLWMHRRFMDNGIRSKLRRIGVRDEIRIDGTRYTADLWRLNVNRASDLARAIRLLLPYALHRKRKRDMRCCLANISVRRRRGSI